MRMLIWKEWHEQGWKIAFACVVLCAFAGIGLRARVILDEEMMIGVCFPAACLLPLLAATGLIPAERGEGSFESLASLPVSIRRIVALKAGFGVAMCVVPIAAAGIVSALVTGGREMPVSMIFVLYARTILSAVMLFAWMFVLTLRLPSEARAAMVSIGIMLCWLLTSAGMEHAGTLATIAPFSFLLSWRHLRPHTAQPGIGLNLIVECVIAVLLGLLATRMLTTTAVIDD